MNRNLSSLTFDEENRSSFRNFVFEKHEDDGESSK
jgi:hypothetical protein